MRQAGEVWIAAIDKIGDELKKIGKSEGVIARDKKGQTRGSKGVPRVGEPPSAAQLGLTKKDAAQARKLHAMGKPELLGCIAKT